MKISKPRRLGLNVVPNVVPGIESCSESCSVWHLMLLYRSFSPKTEDSFKNKKLKKFSALTGLSLSRL